MSLRSESIKCQHVGSLNKVILPLQHPSVVWSDRRIGSKLEYLLSPGHSDCICGLWAPEPPCFMRGLGGKLLTLKGPLLCLHRCTESVARPHSWHTTKFGENHPDASMMQISQGTMGPPWHQSYHSRWVATAGIQGFLSFKGHVPPLSFFLILLKCWVGDSSFSHILSWIVEGRLEIVWLWLVIWDISGPHSQSAISPYLL